VSETGDQITLSMCQRPTLKQHKARVKGKEDLVKKQDDYCLHCCLLHVHVLIHHCAWCHDGLHIILKFQTTIHQMMDLSEMIDISHLEAFVQSTGSQL